MHINITMLDAAANIQQDSDGNQNWNYHNDKSTLAELICHIYRTALRDEIAFINNDNCSECHFPYKWPRLCIKL